MDFLAQTFQIRKTRRNGRGETGRDETRHWEKEGETGRDEKTKRNEKKRGEMKRDEERLRETRRDRER